MDESADGLHGAGGDEEGAGEALDTRKAEGPDPVIGAGLALFGIFVMGLGGARDLHYVFNAGMFIAVGGAVTFVLFVALTAMKQRAARNAKS
ncbi:MAG TPA: hypothetical protein VM694_02920 [Polyangium sp.]|nr:hypothetical protein [Polyangium sp.]